MAISALLLWFCLFTQLLVCLLRWGSHVAQASPDVARDDLELLIYLQVCAITPSLGKGEDQSQGFAHPRFVLCLPSHSHGSAIHTLSRGAGTQGNGPSFPVKGTPNILSPQLRTLAVSN